MNIEQLGHYEAVFEKLQSQIPDDVQFKIDEAREFSKSLKKKAGEKYKLNELKKVCEQASEFQIVTFEMRHIQE